jgi:hypothetical protein
MQARAGPLSCILSSPPFHCKGCFLVEEPGIIPDVITQLL